MQEEEEDDPNDKTDCLARRFVNFSYVPHTMPLDASCHSPGQEEGPMRTGGERVAGFVV